MGPRGAKGKPVNLAQPGGFLQRPTGRVPDPPMHETGRLQIGLPADQAANPLNPRYRSLSGQETSMMRQASCQERFLMRPIVTSPLLGRQENERCGCRQRGRPPCDLADCRDPPGTWGYRGQRHCQHGAWVTRSLDSCPHSTLIVDS